jgi:MFS family permease
MSQPESKQEAAQGPTVEEPYTIYTRPQKNLLIFLVSIVATFSGFASNIYFPAIPEIAVDLGVSSELINLTVTVYLIFQGITPTFWGAISDAKGRRVTYIATCLLFLGACIGLAETKSYAQLMVLRCVQSSGSASTIAIGSGVLGDITTREERGGYMGIFQGTLLLPVAIGPIIGGLFASSPLGWRSIFWFLSIYVGVFLICLIIVLPETLRSLVGNGSIVPKGISKSPLAAWQLRKVKNEVGIRSQEVAEAKKVKIDILGPIRIVLQFQATWSILFVALYYGIWQMILTVLSTLLQTTYGLGTLQSGLVFLANGSGCVLGTLLTGKFLDYDYRRIKENFTGQEVDFPLEKARLRTVWLYASLQIAATIVMGWTLDKDVHISVPIICFFVLGWTAISIQSVVATLLVDIYHSRSASASAALNLVRCLVAAGGTSIVMPIVNGIGTGWCFTLLAGVQILGFGLLVLQMTHGRKLRLRSLARED